MISKVIHDIGTKYNSVVHSMRPKGEKEKVSYNTNPTQPDILFDVHCPLHSATNKKQ